MCPTNDVEQVHEVEISFVPAPNTLCQLCSPVFNVFDHSDFDRNAIARVIPHYQNSSAVRKSAYTGCHLCSLFCGALSLSPDEQTLPNAAHSSGRHGPLEVDCRILPCDSGEYKISLQLLDKGYRQAIVAELSGLIDRPGSGRERAQDYQIQSSCANSTASKASFETASNWFVHCRSEHKFCEGETHSSRTVPTRLLEIEALDQTLQVKLVKDFDPCIEYLILSYCWGYSASDEFILTKSNIQSCFKSISFVSLPKTLRDAISITHRLGFKYLWVDRICIIQDDEDDWQEEAMQMGAFYLNAVCCIAALSSPSSSDGCFVTRNSLIMQPIHIRKSPETELTIFPRVGGIQGDYPRLYRGPRYALTRRAWTLAEQLMSPRTLYYGSLMIYWECRRSRFSETQPWVDLQLPFAEELQKFSADPESTNSLWSRPQSEAAVSEWQKRWASVVECYTSRQMSFAKDRLIAITGMIISIGQHAGRSFAFGLLRQGFAIELLWWQWVDYSEPMRTPINAPTWSWASVTGRISPFQARRYLSPQLQSWTIEAEAKYGDLEAHDTQYGVQRDIKRFPCTITFTAPMLKAQCITRWDLRHYTWWAEADAGLSTTKHLKLRARLWADDPVHAGKSMWLVRMVKLGFSGRAPHYAGLAIEPVTSEANPSLWRRVGYWQSIELVPNDSPSEAERESFRKNIHLTNMRSVVLV